MKQKKLFDEQRKLQKKLDGLGYQHGNELLLKRKKLPLIAVKVPDDGSV